MTPTEHLHHLTRLQQDVGRAEGRLFMALCEAARVVGFGTGAPTYGEITDRLCDMILHPAKRRTARQELPS